MAKNRGGQDSTQRLDLSGEGCACGAVFLELALRRFEFGESSKSRDDVLRLVHARTPFAPAVPANRIRVLNSVRTDAYITIKFPVASSGRCRSGRRAQKMHAAEKECASKRGGECGSMSAVSLTGFRGVCLMRRSPVCPVPRQKDSHCTRGTCREHRAVASGASTRSARLSGSDRMHHSSPQPSYAGAAGGGDRSARGWTPAATLEGAQAQARSPRALGSDHRMLRASAGASQEGPFRFNRRQPRSRIESAICFCWPAHPASRRP